MLATNVLSAMLWRVPAPTVLRCLDLQPAQSVWITTVTHLRMPPWLGAHAGRQRENLAQVALLLTATVLNFSDMILYEAVLTYVGVGFDPSTSSFGGMINLARSEMSRDPVVWWSFAAAFCFMVALVLAANLFADGVRDAFDPRSRAMRPRILGRKPAAKA